MTHGTEDQSQKSPWEWQSQTPPEHIQWYSQSWPDITTLGEKSLFQAPSKVSLALGRKGVTPLTLQERASVVARLLPPLEWAATRGFSSTIKYFWTHSEMQKHEASQRGKERLPPPCTWDTWGGSPALKCHSPWPRRLKSSVCVKPYYTVRGLHRALLPGTLGLPFPLKKKTLSSIGMKDPPAPRFKQEIPVVFTWKTTMHWHGPEMWRREMCIIKQHVGSGPAAMLL